ncbi:MAG: DUF2442 domain-containing protein [Candidatus Margulisbacteria bacterium]|nr:DUF2442 domain-containing protein [Candidatus Margulisiibacteriota bacterium]MBU1616446.1 DUF2442 domain-containing protein [Candidatus Margulisiibacteriota bacterium]
MKIKFENGREGIFSLRKYLDHKGVFSKLNDLNYLKSFYVNPDLGTICWPDGLDIAPERIYSEVEKNEKT